MCERERERGNETRSANREKPDCFFGATGKAKRCPLPSAKEDVWERERERAWPDCSVRAVLEKQQTKEYAFGRQNGRDRPRVIRYIQIAL